MAFGNYTGGGGGGVVGRVRDMALQQQGQSSAPTGFWRAFQRPALEAPVQPQGGYARGEGFANRGKPLPPQGMQSRFMDQAMTQRQGLPASGAGTGSPQDALMKKQQAMANAMRNPAISPNPTGNRMPMQTRGFGNRAIK
jgi:hypothetical protein